MELTKLKYLNARDKKLYDTGCKAIEQKNYKYAVDMLRNLLKYHPGLMEVRDRLRLFELDKFDNKVDKTRQALLPILKVFNVIKGPMLINKGKYIEALDNAEALMAFDPTSPIAIKMLAQAADAAQMAQITINTLEMAVKFYPNSVEWWDWLARTYLTAGMGGKAVECREKIARLDPKNSKYRDDLNEAKAIASEDDRDMEDTSTLSIYITKSSGKIDDKSRQALEKQIQIQESLVQRLNNPENQKKMGDLYAVAREFEKALEAYNITVELIGMMDPALEFAITQVMAHQYDASIEEWQKYMRTPNLSNEEKEHARNEINNFQAHKMEMLIERAQQRLQRQPHDGGIRLELAQMLFVSQRYDEAIPKLEQLRSTSQHGDIATIYLAKCFHAKNQSSKAVELLQQAIAGIPRFSKTKKLACYTLGKICDSMKNEEEAWKAYNLIYAIDENYKDVSVIVEKMAQRRLMASL